MKAVGQRRGHVPHGVLLAIGQSLQQREHQGLEVGDRHGGTRFGSVDTV
jgi:hypothetical protein